MINIHFNKNINHLGSIFFGCLINFSLGQEEYRTRYAGECLIDNACPSGCTCDGTVVDCSGKSLKEIPRDIPLYTTEL